eukprot:1066076-Pleurochrysis_carterae.AAC.2
MKTASSLTCCVKGDNHDGHLIDAMSAVSALQVCTLFLLTHTLILALPLALALALAFALPLALRLALPLGLLLPLPPSLSPFLSRSACTGRYRSSLVHLIGCTAQNC